MRYQNLSLMFPHLPPIPPFISVPLPCHLLTIVRRGQIYLNLHPRHIYSLEPPTPRHASHCPTPTPPCIPSSPGHIAMYCFALSPVLSFLTSFCRHWIPNGYRVHFVLNCNDTILFSFPLSALFVACVSQILLHTTLFYLTTSLTHL